MQPLKILLLAVIAIHLISCGTTRMLTSGVTSKQIDTILYIKPLTSISVINKGNKPEFDGQMSNLCESHLTNKIIEYFPHSIGLKMVDFDSITQGDVDFHFLNILNAVEQQQSIVNLPIPTFLDSLLKKNNVNYALYVYQSGFTRSKNNYAGQIAKGVLIGVLTLGTVYTVPVKANSLLICCIIDGKNKNIAFYRKDLKQDLDPVNPNTTNSQVEDIFERYLYSKDTQSN